MTIGRRPHQTYRSRLCAGLAAMALIAATPALSDPAAPIRISAGPMDTALLALAAQTHKQVVFTPALVAGLRASPLNGNFSVEEALAHLLANTNIIVTRSGPSAFVLRAGSRVQPTSTPNAASEVQAARPFVAESGSSPNPAAIGTTSQSTTPQTVAATVSEIEVTGSHIRGSGPGPSPVIVLDRKALEQTGHATLADALNSLPQVFSGMATEGTLSVGADRSGVNATYATGVNLRGLGTGATLVMVNGRRMAGAGAVGDFADVSTIPTAAVDHVDVLLDGASALYGSDAVGGVVNVVLKRSYEGAETRVLAGSGTSGEPGEFQMSQLLGHHWSTGSLLLAYEYEDREHLPSAARPFTRTADLRSLGGSDHRLNISFPGNILRVDPVTNATVVGWAIPLGQNGVGLRPNDLIAGGVNLSNQDAGVDILPQQHRHSAYLAARQALSDRLEVTADLRYGLRDFSLATGYPITILNVTTANPFFVSPIGATSERIQYALGGDLPPSRLGGSEESLGLSLGAEQRLWSDWRLEGYGAYAVETGKVRSRGQLNSIAVNEALGTIADRPDTAFSTARDGFFNPFSGVAGANNAAVLAYIGSGYSATQTRDRVYTANLQADGTLLTLPGGPLKVAVGVQARREQFFRTGQSFLSTVTPVAAATVDADRDVLAGYAELRAPLVSPALARPGLRSLELSLAGRVERYSDFGSTANPKVGVLWSPAEGLNVRASYGKSFRAPNLRELRDAPTFTTSLLSQGASRVVSLVLSGGNPDLHPETATSWTLGFDAAPSGVPGLTFGSNWFDITYDHRIAQPARTGLANALSDPTLTSFVQHLNPAANAQDRATIVALLANPAAVASSFPPESYGAVVDTRYVNTGSLEVRGFDFNAAFRADVGGDRWRATADASYLYDYIQQVTPTSTPFDTVNQVNFPIKLRGRGALSWGRGAWTSLVAVNYAGAYHDNTGIRLRSQATVDLQLTVDGPESGRWSGLRAALTIRNLFDRDPPFYNSPLAVGYDPANADPIGRYVSLQLTRRW